MTVPRRRPMKSSTSPLVMQSLRIAGVSLALAYLVYLFTTSSVSENRMPDESIAIAKKILAEPLQQGKINPGFLSPDEHREHSLRINQLVSPVGAKERSGTSGYLSMEELEERALRFPSVTERVKVYMSNWYLPSCEGNDEASAHYKFRKNPSTNETEVLIRELPEEGEADPRVFLVQGDVELSSLFFMRRDSIEACDNDFCVDTVKYLLPSMDRLGLDSRNDSLPTLLQFGDSEAMKVYMPATGDYGYHPNLPIIKKFRRAYSRETLHAMAERKCIARLRETHSNEVNHLEPIVWKMTVNRHFGMLDEIPGVDLPWAKKKNVAVFRGGLTGLHSSGLSNLDLDKLTPEEKCYLVPRCKLVVSTADSKLVNARLVGTPKGMPSSIDGIPVFGDKVDFEFMLKHKAVIMLEGSDVSSGLKWALFSNSVVMMQRPKLTSWAMEELLVPWVHYIPLDEDLSDVAERMQWVLNNDDEARRIAHRGSLWIRDLMLHPDADADDKEVFDEMIRRYRQHLVHNPSVFFFG